MAPTSSTPGRPRAVAPTDGATDPPPSPELNGTPSATALQVGHGIDLPRAGTITGCRRNVPASDLCALAAGMLARPAAGPAAGVDGPGSPFRGRGASCSFRARGVSRLTVEENCRSSCVGDERERATSARSGLTPGQSPAAAGGERDAELAPARVDPPRCSSHDRPCLAPLLAAWSGCRARRSASRHAVLLWRRRRTRWGRDVVAFWSWSHRVGGASRGGRHDLLRALPGPRAHRPPSCDRVT